MTQHTGADKMRDAAQDALPRSCAEAELDVFFELSQDLVCITDFAGCFLRLSPSWQRTLGIARAALQSRPWLDWVHPDDRAEADAALQRLRAGAFDVAFRCRFRAVNGAYRWLSWNASALPEQQRIYATARDVTTHRRHESEFERTQRVLHSIVENIPHPIFIKDAANLRFMLLNRAGEELLGCRREELIGKTDEQVFPAEIAAAFARQDRAVLESGRHLDIPGAAIPTKRGERLVHLRKIPLGDATGRTQYILGVAEDITEKERAERALRRSDEQLQSILNHTRAVIYVKDVNERYLLVNRQFEELFHLSCADVVGKTDLDIFPHAIAEQFRINDRRVLENAAPLEMEEMAAHDDGMHAYRSVKFPLCDDAGQAYAVCGISTDISELKATQSALRQSAESLQRARADLGQFAFIAVHDLREPARIIADSLQLLERRHRARLDAGDQEFIARILDSSQRIQRRLDDLLEYSSVSRFTQPLERVDCGQLWQLALDKFRGALESSGAQLACDALPTLSGDAAQLVQLFQNLLDNALKFRGAAPPVIRLDARLQNDHWLFSMRDNGIGIAPEHHERIFRVCQRLHGATEYSGTGIGLAICRKIVERHGGRIWVDSQPGQGATFYFTLPASSA